MPLYGTLKAMPLPDLLQWLGTARRSGTLRVERDKVSKSIDFEEEFPRHETGKLYKRLLRDKYWQDQERSI